MHFHSQESQNEPGEPQVKKGDVSNERHCRLEDWVLYVHHSSR